MSTYPGGKNGSGVYQTIINLMPPHEVYIEPFLGSGAVMRMKRRATISSIGIDSDTAAINSFHGADVCLIHGDAIAWLKNSHYVHKRTTLIYIDPPYLMETRSFKRPIYRHEFSSQEEHIRLLKIIRDLPCMVMISGYESDLYKNMLADWRPVTFRAQTRRGPVTEWVWCNFPEPLELHDYRYLGTGFRERERIKRKKQRWKARLEHMPCLERYALLGMLEELRSPAGTAINSDSTR